MGAYSLALNRGLGDWEERLKIPLFSCYLHQGLFYLLFIYLEQG